ncbi:MAG: tetratricopeptide repeat protein [Clostridia bacterium]|nr:tetratricopeptide repeat protein [Clostridia bacterium]
MKCLECKKKIPDNSVFCPYCGWEVKLPEENIAERVDEKKALTESQRFYDKDYGYSEDNPIVVSSVAMIGNYLASLRNEAGDPFEWEFEVTDTGTSVKKYNLFVNGSLCKSVYFNPNGNDSEYVPAGLVLDKEALEANVKGVPVEEIRQKKEQARESERAKKEKIAERKKRTRKTVKVIAVVAAVALVLAGAVVALVLNLDNIKYAIANGKMNGGAYDEAISMFDGLGDFKDSKDLVNECNYRKAEQLLENGDYESAKNLFDRLAGYKDSKDYSQECDYRTAEQLLENKDYQNAANIYEKIITYKDSKKRHDECLYNQANDLFSVEKYEDALNLFVQIQSDYDVGSKIDDCYYHVSKYYYEKGNYEKSYENYISLTKNKEENDLSAYDLSFKDDLILNYAKSLINRNENDSLNRAIGILAGNDNEEAKELIDQANTLLQKNKYDSAERMVKRGNYINAVQAYEELSGYLDSDEKILETKYEFIKHYLEKMNDSLNSALIFNDLKTTISSSRWKYLDECFDEELYYQYAKELSQLNYKDSSEIYSDLTRWRVGLLINDEEDSYDSKSTISRSETFYGHIRVQGGEYEENTTLQYRITLPSGQVLSDTIDDVSSGYSGWCCAYYNDYLYGATGSCKFEILDSNGEILASETVRITY